MIPARSNACLAVLAIVGAVVAAEPETTPPSRPSPTSVLLPPIQSSPDRDEVPLPSHALPFAPAQSATKQEQTPPPDESPLVVPAASQPAEAEHEEETPPTPDTIREALEREIKGMFPDSSVHLKHTGDTLVVSGSARNRGEATRILAVVHQNTPDRVVNSLRVSDEQPILLRIVVADVDRAALRSLGLHFGSGDKQTTVIPSRPPGDDGSSSSAGNGWIGQALKTLQGLHYAQILGTPALTTLNGQPARFQAGGEFPVPVVSPSPKGAVQGVHFCSYGVRLNVQPVVADNDRIRLTMEAEIRSADPHTAAYVHGTTVPGLKVRTFHSTVELHEGETWAVAGLVHGPTSDAELRAMTRGIHPVSAGNASSGKELVILVSPLLLHPETKEHANGPANARKPRDIKSYLRSRDASPPRDDALYLIGPRGYAGATRQEALRR